jgi:hypothetical protein
MMALLIPSMMISLGETGSKLKILIRLRAE